MILVGIEKVIPTPKRSQFRRQPLACDRRVHEFLSSLCIVSSAVRPSPDYWRGGTNSVILQQTENKGLFDTQSREILHHIDSFTMSNAVVEPDHVTLCHISNELKNVKTNSNSNW